MCDTDKSCQAEKTNYADVYRHLQEAGRTKDVSIKFSMLQTNAERVEFVYSLLREYDLLPIIAEDSKDNVEAGKYRSQGNEFFKVKKYEMAVESYTKSVSLAEDCSEQLAIAYANRSAVLFEKGMFKECLKDIDKALKNNYPDNLKPKLLKRQKMAAKSKSNQVFKPFYQPLPAIPPDSKNKSIECASNLIELKKCPDQGRHVVAQQDINPGDILAIEKPFSHILIEKILLHCSKCLELSYNLVPCPNCTQALYCSEKCRTDDFNSYHRYVCRLLKTTELLDVDRLNLFPMKIAVQVKYLYGKIKNGDLDDGGDIYKSNQYREIHNLEANTKIRSTQDLFGRALTASVLFHLIKSSSDFFEGEDEEVVFKELVLHHLQTAACNFHEISELALNENDIYESEEFGAGAFSFLSMFNHSCSPNVDRHCHGNAIVVRALAEIKKGEQCYDNYGPHHVVVTRSDRRATLKRQYFFDCNCEACEQNWPLYMELPNTDPVIDISPYMEKMQKGDLKAAKQALKVFLPAIRSLERVKPHKTLGEFQEVLKQCFALFGNIKRSI